MLLKKFVSPVVNYLISTSKKKEVELHRFTCRSDNEFLQFFIMSENPCIKKLSSGEQVKEARPKNH